MRDIILLLSTLSVLLIFTHEYDAFYHREWKMFRFLNRFSIPTQYFIFLFAHIPLTLLLLYYLWTVLVFSNIMLWIVVNVLLVFHFAIHVIALRWKSNVFHSIYSFIIIGAAAIAGIINLCLFSFY